MRNFSTMVWCGNVKDWAYDKSGLLTEIYKNYTPYLSGLNLAKAQIAHTLKQSWRMRFSLKEPHVFFAAVLHIWNSKSPHWVTKVFVVFIPLWSIVNKLFLKKAGVRISHQPSKITDLGIS